MKKMIICSLFLIALTINANALPVKNKWLSGGGQGIVEHRISNEKGQILTIACNEDAGPNRDHSITLSIGNNYIHDGMSMILDTGPDEYTIEIPNGTNSRVQAETWSYLIEIINQPYGIPMKIEKDGKIIATFNPKNEADISTSSCTAMFYRDEPYNNLSTEDKSYKDESYNNLSMENMFIIEYGYYDNGFTGTKDSALVITSKSDQPVTFRNVVLNKGNCSVYGIANNRKSSRSFKDITINYGESAKVLYDGSCKIIRIDLDTSLGNASFTSE